ncbi:MAG: RNA methyltransferase [bacterium]
MIEITSVLDSRIGLYRNLKDIFYTFSEKKLFIAEGSIVTEKLLQSDIEIISIFALKKFYNSDLVLINQKKIPPEKQFIAEKQVMNQIVGFRLHQGIMAIGKIPEQTPILDLKPPIIIMNGIVNSENVGAIVRNAVAFGIASIIFDKTTSSPFLRRAVRVSMGTVFSIRYFQSENLFEDIMQLKLKNNFEIIASEITNKSKSIEHHIFNKNCVIIFGSEGKGISEEILRICDEIIYIPISKNVDSLNVAANSAIILNQLNSIK